LFGIGLPEFLVILVVAIVVIGPKDLPRALYNAGKLLRKFRVLTADIQKSLDHVLHEGELDEIVHHANKPGGEDLQQKVEAQVRAEAKDKKNDAGV
jgi:sec-independent protein translocase protein TatB